MSLSREKQRTAKIRQELERLKAEMARQDAELEDIVEAAGITEADLAAARDDYADVIDAQEPLRMQTQTPRMTGPVIRV